MRYIALLHEFLEQDDLAFQELVSRIKVERTPIKENFLNVDFSSINQNASKIFIVYKYYCYLYLLDDISIIEKFKSLGFTDSHLKWFTPLEKLKNEIESLTEGNNPKIFKQYALCNIDLYIQSKICVEIADWAKMTKTYEKKTKISALLIDMDKRFNRRAYGQKNKREPKHTAFEKNMNEQIEVLKSLIGSENETRRFYLDAFKGKGEKLFIKPIIENYLALEEELNIYENKVSQRQMLSRIFGLCQLLLKDKFLKSEEEFFNSKTVTHNNNYTTYQSSTIKKLFDIK